MIVVASFLVTLFVGIGKIWRVAVAAVPRVCLVGPLP